MIPRGINDHHIRNAARWIDKNGIPAGRAGRRYGVRVGGGVYPPKLLISIASKIATGKEHGPDAFIATEAVSYFRARDYRVDGTRKQRTVVSRGADRYWLIKGNPDYYDWDDDLAPGHVESWGARSLPDKIAVNDRLFLWESGGKSRIIGFGEIVRIHPGRGADGRRSFDVRYLTARLQVMPGIRELKRVPVLRAASFLQSGPFATVYPLSIEQADALYRMVVGQNYQDHIWRDLGGVSTPVPPPDADSESWEGNPKMVTHLRRERDPQLSKRKKDQFRGIHGKLFCEACGSDHSQYGRLSENVFEVHHVRPIAQRQKAEKTKLSDLGVLCSNCHRSIHRTKPMLSIAAFGKLLGGRK